MAAAINIGEKYEKRLSPCDKAEEMAAAENPVLSQDNLHAVAKAGVVAWRERRRRHLGEERKRLAAETAKVAIAKGGAHRGSPAWRYRMAAATRRREEEGEEEMKATRLG